MRFGVLGPLAVWTAAGDAVTVPEAKVRALLAGLLTDPGRVVASARLVDFVWPDAEPANPAAAIQTRVSRLRRALGDAALVEHRPPGYRLAVAAEAVDAGRFAALLATARDATDTASRRELLTEALGLWRGEAFADYADAVFVRPVIARLAQQRLVAAEDLAEARLALGEAAAVAAELPELVERQPRRERLRAVQIRALYLAGRQSEALDAYHELRQRLAEELGLDPSPELARLYASMLRQEPASRFLEPLLGNGSVASGARRDTPGTGPATSSVAGVDRPAAAFATGPAETTAAAQRAVHPAAGAAATDDSGLPAGQSAVVTAPPARPTSTDRADAAAAVPADSAPFGAAADFAGSRAHRPIPTQPREPGGNISRPLSTLIGREDELATVDRLWRRHRLVTLTGMGGVGKTSLAVAAATAAPEDTWLVELANLPETATAAQLAAAVAAVLDIRDDAPGADPVIRLGEALRHRRSRLLLDNCEHVVAAVAELVEALLRAAPELSILATSQEPLGIAGEQLFPLSPLRPAAAVALFTVRARAAVPGFTVTDERALAAICERLDGIPLALELAANRVRVLGLAELAERLRDRFGLLTAGRRDAPARQRTLRAMLDWSWELLTAAERIVLGRLAVHADGCTLAAAEAVCAADGVEAAEVLDLLARLVDRSLVQVAHGEHGTRYRLLESVAAYCLQRLRAAGDHDATRLRHARHHLAVAEAAETELRGPKQEQALATLDTEAANLRLAFDTLAAAPDPEAALRLVDALSWYWYLRGRLTEPKRQLAQLLSRPDPGGWRYAHTAVLHCAVRLVAGDTKVIGAGFTAEVAGWFDRITDPGRRARSQWFLSHAFTHFGTAGFGPELVDEAAATFDRLGDCWGCAAATVGRAEYRYEAGRLAEARDAASRGLAQFVETGDRWGQARAETLLGRLAEVDGDYVEAASRHRGALAHAERLGLWSTVSIGHSELGRIALLTGDFAAADRHHERARRVAVEHADQPAREYAELGLALAARRQGRWDEAESLLREWLDWNRALDTDLGLALILAELGFTAEQRGDAVAALAWQREGLAAADRTGNPRSVALALEGLAGARSLAGATEASARLLGAATALRERLGAPRPTAERGDVDRITKRLRAELGADRLAELLAEGAAADPVELGRSRG